MAKEILIVVIYLLGALISYSMQRIEHEAGNKLYTKGDRMLNAFLSLLSWVWVIIMLVVAWLGVIARTGYWKRPVKPIVEPKAETK